MEVAGGQKAGVSRQTGGHASRIRASPVMHRVCQSAPGPTFNVTSSPVFSLFLLFAFLGEGKKSALQLGNANRKEKTRLLNCWHCLI